jgi:imidazolonepropionase-like amidohydrolase
VAAGVDGLEHATLLGPGGVGVPQDLIAEIAARGVTVDPTLGADPGRVPPVDQAPPHIRAMVERLGMTPTEMNSRRSTQIASMVEHGVRVVSGDDAGAAPPKPHGHVWRAVVQLLDAGMSPEDALATATSLAADDCGLGATTGRLAPGLAADVLVVGGDLAADLTALRSPVDVWVRGLRVRRD